jgi:hypothetical protein
MRYIIRGRTRKADDREGELTLRQLPIVQCRPNNRLIAGDTMKKFMFIAGLALMTSMTATAQDVMEDGSKVVLPLEAQSCVLPTAPPPIPDPATKEQLIEAKGHIKEFQVDVEAYRTCINKDAESGTLTQGNLLAITNAHDYSVDMETRVANMFNEALQKYKASLPPSNG